jgi:hypothetical protein
MPEPIVAAPAQPAAPAPAPAVGAPAAGAPAADPVAGHEATVPSFRLRQETEARTAAEGRATAAEAALATARNQQAAWEQERAVMRAGVIDPSDVDVAIHLHSRLPAEGRPPIGDWLGGFRAAPATAPKNLAHCFAAAAAPTTVAPTTPAPAATPGTAAAATAAAATVTPPATAATTASTGYDQAQVRALREEAQRTGDYAKLRAAMDDINRAVMARQRQA